MNTESATTNPPDRFVKRVTFLPFALPDIDDTELEEVRQALESNWITTGPKTKQFEVEFAGAVGAKHAIAVNSCTAAMHLALEAVGVKRGDEVITSAYTFAATAEVVRYFDAKPVLVDIDASSFNVDPRLIERAITPRTRAIIPVHIGGLSARMDEIHAIAESHGLAVIEDAAHVDPLQYASWSDGLVEDGSVGRKAHGRRMRGAAACFSFYATKTITTGEGGMIATDDDAVAERCRVMALHGISKDAYNRYTAEGSWYYEIIAPGYKYNMTDVAAAMGLAQLRKAERMLVRRKQIAEKYTAAFSQVPNLEPPTSSEGHAWHLYMLRLNFEDGGRKTDDGKRSEDGRRGTGDGTGAGLRSSARPDTVGVSGQSLRIDRAKFIEELKGRNIGASVHFIPLHIHPYYRETYGYKPEDFPVAYSEFLREVSLPIYSKMTDEDVRDVVNAVMDTVEKHSG